MRVWKKTSKQEDGSVKEAQRHFTERKSKRDLCSVELKNLFINCERGIERETEDKEKQFNFNHRAEMSAILISEVWSPFVTMT